ncbi:hypothetical protein Mapa_003991 [Marchantia paleacea]|nr:hypothetical protein Mapa_003991 [Marchantia paleacea]
MEATDEVMGVYAEYFTFTEISWWGWIASLSIGAVFLSIVISNIRGSRFNLPPGPGFYPIVGSFPLLDALPGEPAHRMFRRLSNKFGPIVYLKMGSCPTVIISDSESAKLVLKDQDHIFASRPHLSAGKYMGMNYESLVFCPMGNHFKQMRKIYSTELLSAKRVTESHEIRENVAQATRRSLYKDMQTGQAINLSSQLQTASLNTLMNLIFGKKEGQLVQAGAGQSLEELKSIVRASEQVAGEFNIGDYIPIARLVDLTGTIGRMKKIQKRMKAVSEKLVQEHLELRRITGEVQDPKDITFLDVLLSLKGNDGLSDDAISGAILDMIIAGSDTSFITADWAIAQLMKNPHMMKNLQNELDGVVGRDRCVKESDFHQLKYLQCVVKESLRMHSPAPLGIPHCSVQETKLAGYDIPANSTVLINFWALNRDPKNWPDPEEFKPERFEDNEINIFGQDFTLLPFSSGRRGCSGMLLGFTMAQLTVASVIHSFNLEPHGIKASEIDVDTEKPGLALVRASELHVKVQPRLPLHLYE